MCVFYDIIINEQGAVLMPLKLSFYPACFLKEETGYSVIFPDLDFLATCGATLEEAMKMAVDCLAGYLYRLRKEGEAPPKPSSVEELDAQTVARELEVTPEAAFVNMVTVDVEEYAGAHFERPVRKTLTIPAWLNAAALEQNIDFSQVLQDALKEQLRLG